jgi:uncharacterized protein YecT (DUF1311 family)
MRFARLIPLAAFALMATAPAMASEEPQTADAALVADCLALADKNMNDAGSTLPYDLTEMPGSAGHLEAATQLAPTEPESCIGVAFAQCLHDAGGIGDDAGRIDCALREAAVWDTRLNTAYQDALAGMEDDAAANLKKVERAWIAWRDASCAQPYAVYQGTMAGPIEAWCEMNLTARQALWIGAWNN